MQKSLIGLVMSLFLAGPTWAIDYPEDPSLTAGPFVFEPGVTMVTETFVVRALPHTTQYIVLLCPEPGDFQGGRAQLFAFMVQECPIYDREGSECRDWFGATTFGGPFVDIEGNPQRCLGFASTPRDPGGPFRLRLRGELESDTPIELSIQVVPRD